MNGGWVCGGGGSIMHFRALKNRWMVIEKKYPIYIQVPCQIIVDILGTKYSSHERNKWTQQQFLPIDNISLSCFTSSK